MRSLSFTFFISRKLMLHSHREHSFDFSSVLSTLCERSLFVPHFHSSKTLWFLFLINCNERYKMSCGKSCQNKSTLYTVEKKKQIKYHKYSFDFVKYATFVCTKNFLWIKTDVVCIVVVFFFFFGFWGQ